MNKPKNLSEKEKIINQLFLANLKKKELTNQIYEEYKIYLQLIRELLFKSVEEGVHGLLYSQIKDVVPSVTEASSSLNSKINFLIKSQLPLITIEQLKIHEINNKFNKEIDINALRKLEKLKPFQNENFEFEIEFFLDESQIYDNNDNLYKSSIYYPTTKKEFSSLDLDIKTDSNDSDIQNNLENIDLEEKSIASLSDLKAGEKSRKNRDFEFLNNDDERPSYVDQKLNIFDLMDNCLNKLLLKLSYKINTELFKSKLINKLISEDNFVNLVNKNLILKHPSPFVICFDFSINKGIRNLDNYSNIFFIKISTVELEFSSLKLSAQRNKLNRIKNKFELLIKKERYWKQKEIELNKIYQNM